ncbi:MAG TPA: exodeoxyribonuclease III [Acidimicrobiales bacterium]|nr:exodeoxyribonuclease III [Acidimicrobiales bacterium]
MRIATWNVNSLTARLSRVEEWLEYARPDVLCMQETKVSDAAFPAMPLAALGYETATHGDGRWNGVAIASRIGIDDVATGFGSGAEEQGCRIVVATCGGVRVHSVYVPNGRSVDSEHYVAKLEWLAELEKLVTSSYDPRDPLVIAGDFNVAPDDRDVWDPAAVNGATHVTEPERAAVRALEQWGLADAFRLLYDQDKLYSWWDYRAGNFHKHIGMRIDLILLSDPLAKRCRYGLIDRNARKGKQPSDHAPVFVDLED